MDTTEKLEEIGLTPSQVESVNAIIEDQATERALPYAAELLHRIFVRVDRDSVVGRALARALGFTDHHSLERAAKDFGVTKQYLHRMQSEIKTRLAKL